MVKHLKTIYKKIKQSNRTNSGLHIAIRHLNIAIYSNNQIDKKNAIYLALDEIYDTCIYINRKDKKNAKNNNKIK